MKRLREGLTFQFSPFFVSLSDCQAASSLGTKVDEMTSSEGAPANSSGPTMNYLTGSERDLYLGARPR